MGIPWVLRTNWSLSKDSPSHLPVFLVTWEGERVGVPQARRFLGTSSVYFSQTTMFLRGKVSLAIFKIKEPREEDGNLKLLFS